MTTPKKQTMENNLYLSGFWTRIWALLIDTIILGFFGFILGLFLKDIFISLGENARLIGWLISLAYFTLLNSKINNGQTFGKKIMNIQVADIHGDAISLKTSLIRAFILTTPAFINGFRIPGANSFLAITIIQSIIIFTCGIGIILFYIVNKETRQSIHDVVARTYVIQDIRNEELTVMPAVRKLPFYLLGGLFLITLASTIYDLNSNSDFYDSSKLSKLNLVHENILKQDNISDASVFMNFEPLIDSTGTKSFIYTIEIQTNKSIENKANIEDNISNPELKQTVETFIKSKVYETDNDILDVVVNSGFDIGIASQTNSFTIGKSIYKWKEAYRL